MSITLESLPRTTLNTTVDIERAPAWPIPGTQAPNAHLTWAEFVDRQMAMRASMSPGKASEPAAPVAHYPQQPPVAVYPDVDTPAGPGWPLPATQTPHAHLTWAEWLDAQTDGGAKHTDAHYVRAVLQRIS